MTKKFYSMYGKATDANGQTHIVTVVGYYTQEKVSKTMTSIVDVEAFEGKHVEGVITYPYKQTKRTLSLGYSICHPSDEFNEEVGIKLAKRRAINDPIGTLESSNITMLNDDANNLAVFGELKYITSHIEKYLPYCEEYDPNNEECQACPLAPATDAANDTEIEIEIDD